MQSYYVYILWSQEGARYYVGVTENVAIRVLQHNSGESRWTKRYAGSWRLVWQQEFNTLGEARRYENLLKRQHGGKGFYTLTGLRQVTTSSGS